MNKKKILIPICTVIAITSLSFITISTLHTTKEKINTQIINNVNSTDILNENITNNDPDLKLLTSASPDNNNNDSYYVQINNISNGSLKKIIIEDSVYYKYVFDANITLTKDDSKINTSFQTSVILEKSSNEYIIKSLDDFKQDVSKELLTLKNNNSEDISKELNDLSLVYQNDNLDIQMNYPYYYTYTNNPVNDSSEISDTISFYMDEDKTNNYVLITISTVKNKSTTEIINELLKQNYSLEESKFTTPQGLSFNVLKQVFKQDSNDIVETIYILEGEYKNITDMSITVKINSTDEKNKITEVEEIIKSIK